MGAALQFTHTLETMTCVDCGMQFAAPAGYETERRKDGRPFYCPNGHSMSFKETEADRLRKQLAARDREIEFQKNQRRYADDERQRVQRQLIAAKGQATKLRKRVACGVCPACKRTFDNVARHMQSKHPDYAA